MRILVTGGAGFIGSHVVDAAVEAGHEVAVLDNLSTGRREHVRQGVTLHEVDLRDRESVFRVVEAIRPDAVSHQAAQVSITFSMRNPLLDAETNVLGSINLLDACARFEVPRFVFASTGGAIYGEVPDDQMASEDAPPLPQSPYAISKLHVEHLLNVYRSLHGLDALILRYANVYGPRQDPNGEAGVVAIFSRAILEGRSIVVNARLERGDEGCIRDYVFVADVARANLLALEGELDVTPLNVATGVGTSTRELASGLFALIGSPPAIEDGLPRTGDLERSVLSPVRCRQFLGHLTELQAGLESTLRFFQGSSSRA